MRSRPLKRVLRKPPTVLDVVERRRHGPPEKIGAARELLDRVVAMLVKMTKTNFRGGL